MYSDFNFKSLMELRKRREEALNLYDYCLTEGTVAPLAEFIEEQIANNPPPLLLLYEIADDIQQRILSLREHHFDVRNEVIRALQELYAADVRDIFPSNNLEAYHLINAHEVMSTLDDQDIEMNEDERTLVSKLVEKSRETASQLQADISLTEALQTFVNDWLNALTVTAARDYKSFANKQNDNDEILH